MLTRQGHDNVPGKNFAPRLWRNYLRREWKMGTDVSVDAVEFFVPGTGTWSYYFIFFHIIS